MTLSSTNIRPITICVFHHEGKILVAEGYDPLTNEKFYRPIGGGIEHGEHSSEALHREILEEIDEEISNLRFLGIIENIFEWNNAMGHEVVFVYDAKFVDKIVYQKTIINGFEEDMPNPNYIAVWKSLDEFDEKNSPPLYPDELLDLLKKTLH